MFKKFFAGLVLALASVGSASAEFIIDSFNAGQSYSFANGVTATRDVFVSGGSSSFTENGTNASVRIQGGLGRVYIGYTFSDYIGTIDSGVNALRLDILGLTGASTSYAIQAAWFDGGVFDGANGDFAGSVSSASQSFTGIAANSSAVAGATGLTLANRLLISFVRTGAGDNTFTLERLTATPEPTSMLMLGSCLGAGWYARRRIAKGKKAAKA